MTSLKGYDDILTSLETGYVTNIGASAAERGTRKTISKTNSGDKTGESSDNYNNQGSACRVLRPAYLVPESQALLKPCVESSLQLLRLEQLDMRQV